MLIFFHLQINRFNTKSPLRYFILIVHLAISLLIVLNFIGLLNHTTYLIHQQIIYTFLFLLFYFILQVFNRQQQIFFLNAQTVQNIQHFIVVLDQSRGFICYLDKIGLHLMK